VYFSIFILFPQLRSADIAISTRAAGLAGGSRSSAVTFWQLGRASHAASCPVFRATTLTSLNRFNRPRSFARTPIGFRQMWEAGFGNGRAGPAKILSAGLLSQDILRSRMTLAPPGVIAGLYRYPVKGLSPESLPAVTLRVGETLPADRRYAIENGPSGFVSARPEWLSKAHFLMLMRDEWLAGLQTSFEDASHVLTIRRNSAIAVQGNLETEQGRTAIERFFAEAYSSEIKGPPKVLSGGGHSFSDVARKVVSIINIASVRAIENIVQAPVHPLRFRANLHVNGWSAWGEFDLLGRTLAIGETRLKVVKRITRCAAIDVDPQTAARDLNIMPAMMRRLGHADCGVYAEVVAGGLVRVGDAIAAEEPKLL
jgi:hypothetical protein